MVLTLFKILFEISVAFKPSSFLIRFRTDCSFAFTVPFTVSFTVPSVSLLFFLLNTTEAITEKMGGSIEDDSTDDEAIESTANLIAEVAKESQGEATRWANKNKETKTEEEKKAEEERKKKEEEERLKGKVALDEATEKRLKEMVNIFLSTFLQFRLTQSF